MAKFRLLDLFCGAGGSSMGYYRAGFEVVGVDLARQKHYPFEFIQGDALSLSLAGYDAIHASPPCQAYSIASKYSGKAYPDLVARIRERLADTGSVWVIENVPGAPVRADIRLCGCMFGLRLRRERWFETSWGHFELRQPCLHDGPVVSVVGHGTPSWVRQKLGFNPRLVDYCGAMGIDWMGCDELSQALPPVYTEYIGRRIMDQLEAVAMMAAHREV